MNEPVCPNCGYSVGAVEPKWCTHCGWVEEETCPDCNQAGQCEFCRLLSMSDEVTD